MTYDFELRRRKRGKDGGLFAALIPDEQIGDIEFEIFLGKNDYLRVIIKKEGD